MSRLFVGVPLTAGARAALSEHLGRALPGGLPGRPVPPQNWHLTLRFLGETGPEAASTMTAALHDAVRTPSFRVVFEGCGAFPRPARASVLWIGVSAGAAELTALATAAEGAARAAGFPPERKPFTPHLTLSRLRTPEDVRAVLDRVPPAGVAMEVEEVVLYRSHLGGGPPRYEAVERFALL